MTISPQKPPESRSRMAEDEQEVFNVSEFVVRSDRVGVWGLHRFKARTFWHCKTLDLNETGARLERRGQSFAYHTLEPAFEAFQEFIRRCRAGEGL